MSPISVERYRVNHYKGKNDMRNLIFKELQNEKGNILVVTLIILFAVSVIGATMAMVSSMDLKIAGNQRTTTQSLFVAEAGLNEAIHRLSLSNPTDVTFPDVGLSKPMIWLTRVVFPEPLRPSSAINSP